MSCNYSLCRQNGAGGRMNVLGARNTASEQQQQHHLPGRFFRGAAIDDCEGSQHSNTIDMASSA